MTFDYGDYQRATRGPYRDVVKRVEVYNLEYKRWVPVIDILLCGHETQSIGSKSRDGCKRRRCGQCLRGELRGGQVRTVKVERAE